MSRTYRQPWCHLKNRFMQKLSNRLARRPTNYNKLRRELINDYDVCDGRCEGNRWHE